MLVLLCSGWLLLRHPCPATTLPGRGSGGKRIHASWLSCLSVSSRKTQHVFRFQTVCSRWEAPQNVQLARPPYGASWLPSGPAHTFACLLLC